MQYIRARNNRPLLPTSLTEKTAGLDEDYDRLKGGKVTRRPCLYALLGISLLFSVSAMRMRAKHLAVILFRSSSRNMSERGAVTRRLAPYLAWKFAMTPPPVFLHQLCLQFAAITWLGTPVVKAYNTSRTPDHPEEQTFLDENGFVKICLPMLFLFIVDTFSL